MSAVDCACPMWPLKCASQDMSQCSSAIPIRRRIRAFPVGDIALRTYEYPMNGFDEILEMQFETSQPSRAHLMDQGEVPGNWRTCWFSELDFADPSKPTIWKRSLCTGPGTSGLSILREERLTLVEFPADLPPIRFDHEARSEVENVAGHPAYQSELCRLCRLVLRHRMRNMDHTLSLVTIIEDGPVWTPRHRQN